MKKINLKKLADIDFDALLAEAQAKHKKLADAIKAHDFDPTSAGTQKASAEWEDWCRANLADRGIEMKLDAFTGKPVQLFVVVAGGR